jgi:hypothetical protein
MVKYSVELFGMSNVFPDLRSVEIELQGEASLRDVVIALRQEMPVLEGSVIRPGEDRLTSHCSFNVNGRFYLDDYDVKVRSSDHILLVTLALGG